MEGLFFDFEQNDIVVNRGATHVDPVTFATSDVDSQTCALIALSQVCRLKYPEVGAQIVPSIINRPTPNIGSILANAKRMVENDGARDVFISINEENKLNFEAKYDYR